jgi:nucleotide-binding universal stress UspA family protein
MGHEPNVRILSPADGSAGAAAALDKLLATFVGPGLTVDLLAVIDRRPAPGHDGRAGEGASEATGLLGSERARLEEARIEVAVAVRTGHPAEEIVAFAATRKPDLVILGSRPATSLGPGFSGSVASKVARYSPSSVLIARDGRPVGSVVLGYDASPDAETALSLLAKLPFRSPPRVAVCTAFEVPAPLSSGIAPTLRSQVWSLRHEELQEARLAAEALANDAAARLRAAGLDATAHAAHGRACERLTVLAAEIGADLIVVGSRGLSGIERFLLGSTSGELVAMAPTSVLVARS